MKMLVGMAFAIGVLAVVPASAAENKRSEVSAAKTSPTITDFSAKRRKAAATAVTPVQVAPATSAWTGPDPSKGPGIAILRQMQREGRCVLDEGYGRYTSCSNM